MACTNCKKNKNFQIKLIEFRNDEGETFQPSILSAEYYESITTISKTWQKILHKNFKLKVLDYSNLLNYLDKGAVNVHINGEFYYNFQIKYLNGNEILIETIYK